MAKGFDVYEMITKRFIEKMEEGKIPWVKPWHTDSYKGISEMFPAFSYSTKKPYDIINQMLLDFTPGEYLTFKQIKDLGGKVKKGEKASIVVGWVVTDNKVKGEDGKVLLDEDGNEVTRKRFGLRYYNVFNVLTQVEGIEPHKVWELDKTPETIADPNEAAEAIINKYLESGDAPKFIVEKSNSAYYSPAFDEVHIPEMKQFDCIEEYYSTAFHELTHSTLKASRCNRQEKREGKNVAHGSKEYSKEELVAEIGAAALVNIAGLETEKSFRNSTAYLQGWLSALKNDNRMIVYASAEAQKAINFILGK